MKLIEVFVPFVFWGVFWAIFRVQALGFMAAHPLQSHPKPCGVRCSKEVAPGGVMSLRLHHSRSVRTSKVAPFC